MDKYERRKTKDKRQMNGQLIATMPSGAAALNCLCPPACAFLGCIIPPTGNCVVSLPQLIQAIRERYALPWGGLHGVSHWGRVYENGVCIAPATGGDAEVLVLFCLFHDACRLNEGRDEGHGRRGAELAAQWRGQYFDVTPAQFDLVYEACALHTDGLTEGDRSLKTCWDADRLDLARASILPTPERLCTDAARDPVVMAWATERSLRRSAPTWLASDWGTQPDL